MNFSSSILQAEEGERPLGFLDTRQHERAERDGSGLGGEQQPPAHQQEVGAAELRRREEKRLRRAAATSKKWEPGLGAAAASHQQSNKWEKREKFLGYIVL